MKHISKRLMILLISAVTLLSTISAYAVTQRWTYLTLIEGSIDISNGVAEIIVSCDATRDDVTKVKAKCELQKFDESWETIKTWTETETGTIINYEKTYAVSSNYEYRLKVTGYAYNGSTLLESATEYFYE